MSDPIRLSIPDGYYAPADVRQIIADLREQVGEPLTEERAAWEALLVEARAEIAKLRALVPGVGEWDLPERAANDIAVRRYNTEDGPTAMEVFYHLDHWFFMVRAVDGSVLHDWTWDDRRPTRDEAIRDCEAAARALGVLS